MSKLVLGLLSVFGAGVAIGFAAAKLHGCKCHDALMEDIERMDDLEAEGEAISGTDKAEKAAEGEEPSPAEDSEATSDTEDKAE